ncbi:MAG: hypothetical protein HFJ95_02715 [Muribaculaceae bacterium]|jgi:hypothetical protein|nr:hypothetical protein [Muribaculaceae bacterium]
MDLTPIFITGIVFITVYRIFELFVRRRERLAIIDKIGQDNGSLHANLDLNKILYPTSVSDSRYTSLKWGCLALGLGAGLFCYVLIAINQPSILNSWSMKSTLSGSLTLLGGGLGLIIAFIVETLLNKSNRNEE